MDGILTSIKKLLGIPKDYTQFDTDIIVHINSTFNDLASLGVTSANGFSISDDTATWDQLLPDDKHLEAIKSYIYLRVRLLFDPPSNSSHLQAINNQIEKYEWLINVWSETV